MSPRITDSVMLQLVGQIYDAASDPTRWPEFLSGFARAVGGHGTLIYSHNVQTLETSTASADSTSPNAAANMDPQFLKSLGEYYNRVNVWAQNEAVLKPGKAVTGSMLYPVKELPKTEFYSDWLRPQEFVHALGGLIVQDGAWATKFSCGRSNRAGDYGADELRLYEALLPHLARATHIQRRFAFLQRPFPVVPGRARDRIGCRSAARCARPGTPRQCCRGRGAPSRRSLKAQSLR